MKTEHSSKDSKNEQDFSDESSKQAQDQNRDLNDQPKIVDSEAVDLVAGSQSQNDDDTPASDDLPDEGDINDLNLTEDDDDDQSTKIPSYEYQVQSFEELEIEPALLDAIRALGWTKPTPVQGKCLPLTLVGRDVAGFAQTGTGKTGVFLITLANTIKRAKDNMQKGGPKAFILVPTRELAVQIHSDALPIFDALNISSLAVYGGVDYEKQGTRIKQGVDVIVATPGRLKDYYQKKFFNLNHCNQFVCDEADRMFDMGFVEDIEFFLGKLSEKTQKLLFSATTNDDVKELAFEYLEDPEYISVNPEVMTPERIEQHAILCESTQKLQVMLGLLREHQPNCAIIFSNTKLVAEWLHYKLKGNGIEADLITGDLPQRKRISLINQIKAGQIKALIATDVASRGLHITGITHVYNFDLPNEASNYVHRIGRTARAGAKGHSYSLVCEDYGHNLQAIKDYLGDQVAIETNWYDEKYLEIQDVAGNPYQDPEFKGNTMKSENTGQYRKDNNQRSNRPKSSSNQQDQRGGNRPQRDGGQNQRRGGNRSDRDRNQQNQQKKGRSNQPDRGQQHSDSYQKDRKKPTHSRSRHGNNRSQNRYEREPKTQQPAPQTNTTANKTPSTIGGIFKRIVSLMLGRKN